MVAALQGPKRDSRVGDRMDLIAAADAALQAAKRGGKNRVERAEKALTEPLAPHR
jgi:GGDEF domain-containing protein